jgi:hypothetical protein
MVRFGYYAFNQKMPEAPKPNTLAVSWFYGEDQKKTLILTPKYQRNPIWSIGQKCFLIDSLIFGCPIPQVYINIKTEGLAKEKKTFYEVVDGQQRLRAILEFLNDKWPLIETTARSYPVSALYRRHIGKKYSELPEHLQNVIWDYPLAVQELRGKEPQEIQALFRRLNYVVERLNPQELRHSQYFGEFIDAVESLTKEAFWDDVGLFSRRDAQRMKDTEFISELFIIVVDGIQEQQKTLDDFYAAYDVVFQRKAKSIAKFKRVLAALHTISDTIRETRFRNKSDFYGLFAAVNELSGSKSLDLNPAAKELAKLSKALDAAPETFTGVAQEYYTTIAEGANKLAKRSRRMELLRDILKAKL